MKYSIYKWFCVSLLLIFAGSAIAQNLSLDILKMCSNSTNCNPFLNGYICQTASLRTTHGSPAFYLPSTNQTRQIQLEAALGSNGTNYSEGFTLAYQFKAGTKYRVKINHMGMYQPGAIFPILIAALTNAPPRFDDGCSLGYLTTTKVVAQYNFTVSSTATTSSFDFQPTEDIPFLWLRSNPVQVQQAGLLIFSINITDFSVPAEPGGPERPGCGSENWNFCHPNHNWVGGFSFVSSYPVYLHCDVFTTHHDPLSLYRYFTAPTITLSNGFIASAYDYAPETPNFRAIASANPCNQRITTFVDTVKAIKREIHIEQQYQDNILIYPVPSPGIVRISCNNKEIINGTITILDQSSRPVYQKNNQANSSIIELNLQNLPNGIYFIKINSKDKSTVRKLIISK